MKTIIFCADGTWNGPSEEPMNIAAEAPVNDGAMALNPVEQHADMNNKGINPKLTNVCKLFGWLKSNPPEQAWGAMEMELVLGPEKAPIQMAKYIHGVGDSQDVLDRIGGGAFGIGVVARIARGYTYISRNYVAGDKIVIIGFSRGAYTARALAGLIVAQGLLRPELAINPDNKYNNAFEAWYRYRNASKPSLAGKIFNLFDQFSNTHKFALSSDLQDSDFIDVPSIAAVAVWDTVGAMGIPIYDQDHEQRDIFQFANRQLSDKVLLGLHAVSLDEQRDSFVPTLWNETPNVTQALFSGGHSDVGGGNPEHDLSDIPLLWFVDRLQHADVGLLFQANPRTPVTPDPGACAHSKWTQLPWSKMGVHPRKFPANMVVNDAVRQRRECLMVQPDSEVAQKLKYDPINLPSK